MKAKNDFQAQRDVLKSLAEGGPGSTRWGDRAPQEKMGTKRNPLQGNNLTFKAADNSIKKHGVGVARQRMGKADRIRKDRAAEHTKIGLLGAGAQRREGEKLKATANSIKKYGAGEAAWRNQTAADVRTARQSSKAAGNTPGSRRILRSLVKSAQATSKRVVDASQIRRGRKILAAAKALNRGK